MPNPYKHNLEMNNYKKAKEEGILVADKKFVGLTPVGLYMKGDVDEFMAFLSSFAEKIKEGVIDDLVANIDELTWSYKEDMVDELEVNTAYLKVHELKDILSDSQTIKE